MGTLYIVATPIGNLKDITLRALSVLKSVDFIVCEDTRQTKKLLSYYNINKPSISYHQHSKTKKIDYILNLLLEKKDLALVSDAGTPGISDPGNKLIKYIIDNNKSVNIIPIPGPSALITALSVCGFACDKFVFLGFPPKKRSRTKYFKQIAQSEYTVGFYESPHRILKTLNELDNIGLNDCKIVIGRELTKKFETIYRGNLKQIINQLNKKQIKGEFVIIISNK